MFLGKVSALMATSTSRAYVLRVSQVLTHKGSEWRISIVDTASQERFHFGTFEALVQFLAEGGQTLPETSLQPTS